MVKQGGLGRGLASLIPQKRKTTSATKKINGVKNETKKSITAKKSTKKKFLGRESVGETNYFGGKNSQAIMESSQSKAGRSSIEKSIMEVDVRGIVPNPYQPRTNFDQAKLQELADSIAEHGIIQPLVVSRQNNGGYELIAGERRLEAAKLAGLNKVPVVARQATEQNKAEWALIENIQRHNLNPIEEAQAYEKMQSAFGLTQIEIAKKVGKSRSAVANILRLLNLPEEIREALIVGKITEGHARTILALSDEKKQLELFRSILREGLNVRQVEGETKKMKVGKNYRIKKDVDPDLLNIENEIADNLKTKVKIRGIRNNGKILIDYYSEEELGQIVEKLRGE